jgi:hypothetical protein
MEHQEMTAQEQFWVWFVAHERELFDFDPNQVAERERIFDELQGELRKVDPDLTFEFGPNEPRREFVISAGGIQRAFPAVVWLARAAPALEQWQVTAFRPRRPPLQVVEFGEERVAPEEVQFSLLDNGKIAGIHLFIHGFRDDDADLKQIAYFLLDGALGEYDVESRLGLIEIFSPQTATAGTRCPLADLPARFDRLVSQLEGRCGRPESLRAAGNLNRSPR